MTRAVLWVRVHCVLLGMMGLLLLWHPAGDWAAWCQAYLQPLLPSHGPWPRMLGLQMTMMGVYLWVLAGTGDRKAMIWSIGARSFLPIAYGLSFWTVLPIRGLWLLILFELSWLLGFFACLWLDGKPKDTAPIASPFATPSWLHQYGLGAFPFVEGLACLFCLGLWSHLTFHTSPPKQPGWAWLFGLQSCYLGIFWLLMVRFQRQEALFATLIGRLVVASSFAAFVWTGVVPGTSRYLLLAAMLSCSSAWSWLELTGKLHLDQRGWKWLRRAFKAQSLTQTPESEES